MILPVGDGDTVGMHTSAQRDLAKTLRSLKASILQTLQYVDDLSAALELVGNATEGRSAGRGDRSGIQIDHRSFTVSWRGSQCHLGYTLPYRLLEILAHRPDQYLSNEYLLRVIWSGQRSRTAVRSVVSDLRRRLIVAGMDDLAALIDGSNRGHYGLMLSRR